MVPAIIFVLSAGCPDTVFENRSSEAWNRLDMRSAKRAVQGCKDHYDENHCLDRFIKKDVKVYWAICKEVKNG